MLGKYALLKALKEILSNPGARYSVRELGRKAGLSPSASKASLDYMRERGMAKFEKVGRSFQFEADLSSPLTRQWKILLSVDELERAGVVKKILKELRDVGCILLYGSASLGTDDKKSDIDILIIAGGGRLSPKTFGDLGREANVIIYKPSEWRAKAIKDKVFYERVILDSIALYGNKPVVI